MVLPRQQGMDPIAHARAQPRPAEPLTQLLLALSRLSIGNMRPGHQIAAQQRRQGSRVHFVGLDPGIGDQARLQGIGQHDVLPKGYHSLLFAENVTLFAPGEIARGEGRALGA